MSSESKVDMALHACAVAVAGEPPNYAEAIDRALEAWGEARHPRIADLVDRLSSAYEPEARAKALEARKKHHAARAARAKNTPDLHAKAFDLEENLVYLKTRSSLDACWQLIAMPDEFLDDDPKSKYFAASDAKRMAATRRPDPRMARALFRVLCEPKLYRERRPVDPIITKLIGLRDGRFATALQDWLESANLPQAAAKNGSIRANIDRLQAELATFAANPPPLSTAALAHLEAIEGRLPAETVPAELPRKAKNLTKVAADVLEMVFADPENTELRRVASDRLQELGDLRGELIALQLALHDGTVKEKTDAAAKRIKALLHKNAGHWSGPVGPIGRHETVEFELGFISSTVLDKSSIGVTADMWQEALETPYWATVKKLTITEVVPDWWLQAFLPSTHAARIRTLEVRDRHAPKPDMVFRREKPGAPLRLVSASGMHKKFPKMLKALTPEHLEALAEDVQKLSELSAAARQKLADALAKALNPPAPKKKK